MQQDMEEEVDALSVCQLWSLTAELTFEYLVSEIAHGFADYLIIS